ncbi:hypothetical protein O3P69_004699 [Scylla paramamosain]|uniref:Uncharacterized protein n=2 Tax=Scylla paramamosain TaxID=85552 RepID=A0AAW0UC28_SCYPA
MLDVAVPPCKAGSTLNKLLPQAVDAIVFMVGQPGAGVSFLGNPCLVETNKQENGSYTAKMSCAPWTNVVGEARSMVELQATKSSIRNFMMTASDYKLFTIEEVTDWLASY